MKLSSSTPVCVGRTYTGLKDVDGKRKDVLVLEHLGAAPCHSHSHSPGLEWKRWLMYRIRAISVTLEVSTGKR
ncbi:uncharacterized protein LAESUDRAFT_732533 [Laetiporus sulphureus 93-53]|uniref:Uncharacterized protein n=1 Tax=Laetiporus sulphureus 93-53 TaxID=1314785 RepID=A0A165B4B1_9APHY|nr:uncharacterized protein LAESUDRAFT_732533 [Laetiporus sulphureus 93-53]KZT00201.1 hypothetical protein LAESUDRAFT_732533 [Laetiporus sulphureus 93-53]